MPLLDEHISRKRIFVDVTEQTLCFCQGGVGLFVDSAFTLSPLFGFFTWACVMCGGDTPYGLHLNLR